MALGFSMLMSPQVACLYSAYTSFSSSSVSVLLTWVLMAAAASWNCWSMLLQWAVTVLASARSGMWDQNQLPPVTSLALLQPTTSHTDETLATLPCLPTWPCIHCIVNCHPGIQAITISIDNQDQDMVFDTSLGGWRALLISDSWVQLEYHPCQWPHNQTANQPTVAGERSHSMPCKKCRAENLGYKLQSFLRLPANTPWAMVWTYFVLEVGA